MNIGKILDFKPDTELRGENPFERTEIERQRKAYGEPESKKSKFAVPAYMESVSDGIRLTEAELEERRQELLAKAEIDNGEQEDMDEAAVRKLFLLFDKRMKKNQDQRIKYAQKPEKYMNSEMDLYAHIHEIKQLATQPHLYPLFWDEDINNGLTLVNLISLASHENTDIAAMVIETLYDLLDQEEEENEEIVKVLYQKYMEQDVLSVAVGNLKRMDETKNEEMEAAFKSIGLVESIIDGSDDQDIISKVANSGNFLLWLLERVRRRTINMVKVYAAEILSVLLQGNEENQKIIGEKKGVDILLKQLAYFKKRNPKGQEEIELMENLFDALCFVVQYPPNRKKFLEDEGLHLMNLMIREKKMSRNSALKVINHVVSGREGRDNSVKYVEILGLKTLFPLFMKTPKRNKKTGHTENDHEEAIVSIIGNLMRNLSGSLKRRLVDKFVELDHAKSERLLELHFKYAEKMETAEEEVEQQAAILAQEGVEMDDDMAYALRLEKGLFTLQQIDYIIVELYGSGIDSLRERIISHLSMRKSSLKQIREVVKDYADNLGDGENEEAIEQERNRLLELAMGLM